MDSIKILFWNCNGLRTGIDELRDFVQQNPVDLILIQEVKCKSSKFLKIKNYKLYHTPRITNNEISNFGGTAIFVNNKIPHAHIPSLDLNITENTNIQIYIDKRNSLVISSVYIRILNNSNIPNIQALPHDLEKLLNLHNNVILAGDFNSHHTSWDKFSDPLGNSLYNFCTNKGVEIVHPLCPTRYDHRGNGTTIDLALLNNIPYPFTLTPMPWAALIIFHSNLT